MARSMRFFVPVGAAIGAGAALFASGLGAAEVPAPVSAVLVLGLLVFLTGNLHLDGLMDTADGVLGSRNREKALDIMRDSRVGAHGAAAGSLMLILKFALLEEILRGGQVWALVLPSAYGRWALVYGASLYPYARKEGLGRPFFEGAGRAELGWASLSLGAILGAHLWGALSTTPVTGVLLLGATPVVAVALLARWFAGRLGGLTGDCLGALCEVAEAAALLGAVWVAFGA